MSGERTVLQKVTTLGVLAAVLWVAFGFAVLPYIKIFSLFEESATTQQLVDSLDRQVSKQQKISEKNAGSNSARPEEAFVTGETTGIAGAGLQSRLAELIGRNGGRVKALLVLPPSQGAKANLVSVNVVANVSLEGLREILYDIETSIPILFVDNIAISVGEDRRDKKANRGPVRVDVTMLVSGYRSLDPQS